MGTERAKRTFVIAECCSSWRFGGDHLANAFRMIEAAKACDADAAKFQWCSDPVEMSKRRNDNNPANYEILVYPIDWLHKLKAKCDEVGIEFMCTAFIERDISTVAPLVKRFKVASAESSDVEFIRAHQKYSKSIITSYAFGSMPSTASSHNLHCVCSYPTPIDQVNLARLLRVNSALGICMMDGLSDHTTSTLTGALAVAAGATIIEKHIKLDSTPPDNPDYPHSLVCIDTGIYSCADEDLNTFAPYVSNIREAELAMGSGENIIQECEKANLGRRVKS